MEGVWIRIEIYAPEPRFCEKMKWAMEGRDMSSHAVDQEMAARSSEDAPDPRNFIEGSC
jgi:hypothetical protein